MAANKEAICILLDVGPSMGQSVPGEASFLQISLEAISMIMQRKIFSESKDEIAVVVFGSEETDNPLDDGLCYQNISVVQPLSVVNFEMLELMSDIKSTVTSADFIDALVVGLDQLVRSTTGRKGFAKKRIILFSDLGGEFGDDQLEVICNGINSTDTQLNVIGPNLDTDEGCSDVPSTSSATGKMKTAQQRAGEATLCHILEKVDGDSYSFSEALPALSNFQARQIRPTAWKCDLQIGANLSIPICGYIKVKEFKLKQSWKRVYAREPEMAIKTTRAYVMNDEDETEVDKDDIIEGHRYGNTLVPMTEDDKENMKYRAEKCFQVLGFTEANNIKPQIYMGDSVMYVMAEKDNEAAGVALSALIHALYETNMVAVVRRVYSNSSSPRIGVLQPSIKKENNLPTQQVLIYIELPYSEDVRQFTFASLPMSEESSTNKKYAPSEEQLSAIDRLITDMDLTAVMGPDGEKCEILKPSVTFNPYFQRIYQALQQRAINPDEQIPELNPLVARYMQTPASISQAKQEHEKALDKLFKLEVVENVKAVKSGEEQFHTESGEPSEKKIKLENDFEGDIGGLLRAEVTEVGTVTPVEDFKTLLSKSNFVKICEQLQSRLSQIVLDSFGSQLYSKALDCLCALRTACCMRDQPNGYNGFIRDFRDILINSGRRDFLERITEENLGLIEKQECESSCVTKEEAINFLSQTNNQSDDNKATDHEDADDLLADL